jgi:hypothetical protein
VKVKVAPRALQRARIITTWWRKNRPGAEDLFEREFLEVTSKFIAMSPGSPLGTVHTVSRGKTIRRVLLPRTEQHIYYSVDEANDTVIVRMIWGARRGRSPKL